MNNRVESSTLRCCQIIVVVLLLLLLLCSLIIVMRKIFVCGTKKLKNESFEMKIKVSDCGVRVVCCLLLLHGRRKEEEEREENWRAAREAEAANRPRPSLLLSQSLAAGCELTRVI